MICSLGFHFARKSPKQFNDNCNDFALIHSNIRWNRSANERLPVPSILNKRKNDICWFVVNEWPTQLVSLIERKIRGNFNSVFEWRRSVSTFRTMSNQLTPLSYLFLMAVNSCIGFLGFYSIGLSDRNYAQVNELLSHTHQLNYQKERIYSLIMNNCSMLFEEFSELRSFPNLNLCQQKDQSVLLMKLTIGLSTLYNTYWPYALYGPPALPVVILIIASFILGCTQFFENIFAIRLIELTSIMAGFAMIFGNCIIDSFGIEMTSFWRRFQGRVSSDEVNNNDANIPEHQHKNWTEHLKEIAICLTYSLLLSLVQVFDSSRNKTFSWKSRSESNLMEKSPMKKGELLES